MPIPVHLSSTEIIFASLNASFRRVCNRARGRRPANGLTVETQTWDFDIHGAIGELALAKAMDRYPHLDASAPGRHGDLPRTHLECRHTVHHHGHLCLYPGDDDSKPFVLVTGEPPQFIVQGWIYAREGKLRCYWIERDPRFKRPCYAVPQTQLRSTDTLPEGPLLPAALSAASASGGKA